jgi:negative regulator of flagellin synthesis FlgM
VTVANIIKGLDGGSIGSDNSSPIEQVRPSTAVNSAASGASASTPPSDSVHITESARTLASLSQAVSEAPDVDLNRVSAVQSAISNGSYQINAQNIADKLLHLERDLGGAQHK